MLTHQDESTVASSNTDVRQALAHASEWQDWNCWLYTVMGHRLILCAEHGPGGYSSERRGYLVFRSPRYVRLPWFISEPGRVRSELAPPPLAGGAGTDHTAGTAASEWRVRVVSDEPTYEVACRGVGFHVGPIRLPSPFHPSVDYIYRSQEVVRLYDGDSSHRLQAFLGESVPRLEWSGLHVSHEQFRLLASGFPGGGVVELRFFGTGFLDLPTSMSDARLHVATSNENQAVRELLPSRLIDATYPPKWLVYRLREGETPRAGDREIGDNEVARPGDCAGHVIIDCREGTYHLLAAQVTLRRLKRRSYAFSRYLARPLWSDGPPVSSM